VRSFKNQEEGPSDFVGALLVRSLKNATSMAFLWKFGFFFLFFFIFLNLA
jgi:hypothetical protein